MVTGKWADEVNDQLLRSRKEERVQMKIGKGKVIVRKVLESRLSHPARPPLLFWKVACQKGSLLPCRGKTCGLYLATRPMTGMIHTVHDHMYVCVEKCKPACLSPDSEHDGGSDIAQPYSYTLFLLFMNYLKTISIFSG